MMEPWLETLHSARLRIGEYREALVLSRQESDFKGELLRARAAQKSGSGGESEATATAQEIIMRRREQQKVAK